jgi:hypothetical protein|nr:MAG TPA: hypothetical protein [Podoviridae sp. ctgHy19]
MVLEQIQLIDLTYKDDRLTSVVTDLNLKGLLSDLRLSYTLVDLSVVLKDIEQILNIILTEDTLLRRW